MDINELTTHNALSTDVHGLSTPNNIAGLLDIVSSLAAFTGSTNLVTLGTIITGVWHASVIGELYGGTGKSTYTLGDTLYSDATNSLAKLPGNTTAIQKFLAQTGNGSISAAPSWQSVPVSGLMTFFFIDTASDIGGVYKQQVDLLQYTPATKASVTATGATTGTVVGTFATNSAVPGITFIPDGIFHLHIHALHSGGAATITLEAQIYSRTTGGTETLIVTSEETGDLSTSELEFDISAVLAQPVSINSTDRIVVKWVATCSAARDITIYYDGTSTNETFSRLEMPVAATLGGGSGVWGSITGTLSSQADLQTALNAKQDTLVSGTNIKTINTASILGSGDLTVTATAAWGSITGTLSSQTDLNTALGNKQDTLVSGTNIKTVNSISLLGSGDVAVAYPGRVTILSPDYLTKNGTWVQKEHDTNSDLNWITYNSSSASGDYVDYDFWCDAGTYTVLHIWSGFSTSGIIKILLDGSQIDSFDAYSSGGTRNNIRSITSVSVAAAGKHTMRLLSNTKNGSSSAYRIHHHYTTWIKT